MKNNLFDVFILSLLLVFFVACQGGTSENALRFDIEHLPRSLDPQITKEEESRLVLLNTMEGLTKINQYGEVEPACAESWEISADGLQYAFKIKNNLKWEDGTPLTAKDFKFALERIIDSKTNSPFLEKYLNIKNAAEVNTGVLPKGDLGISVLEDGTLVITLCSQDKYFLNLMADSSALPCNPDFFNKSKGKYGLTTENFLSNGAFKIFSRESDMIVMEKNDKAQNPARVDKFYLCTDRGDPLKAFSEARSEAVIVPFEREAELSVQYESSLFDRSFVLMINPESEVGRNAAMRRILLEAVLHDGVWNTMGKNILKSQGIIPPTVFVLDKNYRDSVGEYSYPLEHLDKPYAKDSFFQQITEMGLEKLPKTTLIASSGEPGFSFASAMQQIWSHDLSTYINIEQPSEMEISSKIARKDYDLAITPIFTTQNDAWEFLGYFSDCTITIGEETKTAGEFLGEVKDLNTAEGMAAGYGKIERALIDENFVLPLFYAPTHFVVSPRVKNIQYIPAKRSIYFGEAEFI